MNYFQSNNKRTLTTILPKDDFEKSGKEVKFLGNYGGFHVYRWERNTTEL